MHTGRIHTVEVVGFEPAVPTRKSHTKEGGRAGDAKSEATGGTREPFELVDGLAHSGNSGIVRHDPTLPNRAQPQRD